MYTRNSLKELKCQEVVLENTFLGLAWPTNLVHCKRFSLAEFTLALMQHCDGTEPLLYSSLFQTSPVLSRIDSSQNTTLALRSFGEICWSPLF